MFVYGGNGETDGPAVLTNKEFYKKVANQYTALLSSYTAEGQCYRVDLRLRPDGTLGEIAVSEEGARLYYSERARDWEKQMLIKARISAGESEPGATLLEFVEPLIYQSSLDFRAVEAVSETRQRISEKLAARRGGHGGLDVKLTPGGIRDIEFLVQCLQRLHGGREQWVRHGGTVFALFRLRDKGFLSDGEYARLSAAYSFLRYLEHRLQMEEDRQTHTLPNNPARLNLLARKMPPDATGLTLDGADLKQRLQEHLSAVREIYHRVVHAYRQPAYTPVEPHTAPPAELEAPPPDTNLERVLGDRAPRLAHALAAAHLRRGRARFESFLEEAVASPELLGAPRKVSRRRVGHLRAQRPLRRSAPPLPGTAGGNRRAVPTRRRTPSGRRCAAPFLPPPDAAHPVRKHARAAHPSSRRSARPACSPTASSPPPTASRSTNRRRPRAPATLPTIR